MLLCSSFIIIPDKWIMILRLAPLTVIEDQISLEARITRKLLLEIWLTLAQINHKVLSVPAAHDAHLSEFIQNFIKCFDSLNDSVLLQLKVMDDTALILSKLGANSLFVPDKKMLFSCTRCFNLV